MNLVKTGADAESAYHVLWQDGERLFSRRHRHGLLANGESSSVLAIVPALEHQSPASLDRLANEYALRDELAADWALRPLELVSEGGRTILLLEDPGGEPLSLLLGDTMAVPAFLRMAIGVAAAVGKAHQRGIIHKDIKPAHIWVNRANGQVRLTGFGIASRVSRERQSPDPPAVIAGTFAYMAPEQTGRMNRSIDSRSDLYGLGVTFYQMLTGSLPFTAVDPAEWIHCHIAKRPVPPSERVKEIPNVVSAMILKLLAKTAEERYQTAAGLEADLRYALAQSDSRANIGTFLLGTHDQPDRVLISERLYGREREGDTLLAAFNRVVAGGGPELVLVAGHAGVGKSAVVKELYRSLALRRGLFASGKFDQYQRDIPYASLAQALLDLIHPLLTKSEAELTCWRTDLTTALGPNGGLIVTLVPELEHLIGPQPPLPELPAQDAQRRFHLVFRRLLGMFARPDHPLALFLDDLQWLDTATLDLLEDLLAQADLKHLLIIAAYRDDEVTLTHPLSTRLMAMRQAGTRMQEILLPPLRLEHVTRVIADALHSGTDEVMPLARLVYDKTAGNPFFVIQFLFALADEGLLEFQHSTARWTWDRDRISAKGYTDNVVDLMVGKLRRLPTPARTAMKHLACLGNSASVHTLSLALGRSEEALEAAFEPAVRAGLVLPHERAYRFLHDRVQEAVYALIPEDEREAAHLAIGRRLVAHMAPKAVEGSVFEIVGQLNHGAALITANDEREELAAMNLAAGRRAKSSAAYDSALTYFRTGAALLPQDRWERLHELAFALELHQAECKFLTGRLTGAEKRLSELATRAASFPELVTVTRMQVDLFMTLGRSDRAVEVGLDTLRRVDIDWSPHPTKEVVQDEYTRIWQQLGDRPIEALLDLPRLADPVVRGTMEVLTSLVTPALFTDESLRHLVIGRMGNLSLEHGNSDVSAYAYTVVGTVLGLHFGNYNAGFRFGQLGLDLVNQAGMDRLKARVYLAFGNLAKSSSRHVQAGRSLPRQALDTAQQAGDLTYTAFGQNNLLTYLIATGEPLAQLNCQAEAGLTFARQAGFGLVADLIQTQLRLVRTLRGFTTAFGCFDEPGFDEEQFERHLEEKPSRSIAMLLYCIRKLQARVLSGDHAAALAAASKAERLLWMSPAIFERVEYHFWTALALVARCDGAEAAEGMRCRGAVAAHRRRLDEWAQHCPEHFESRAALIGAEIARLEGNDLEAQRLYEHAISSARNNGLVHDEALANERAARFYDARGFEKIARAYLKDAYYCYARWGADGKVRQLQEFSPDIHEDERFLGPTKTVGTPVEHLDLATVVKVSQAVSGEVDFEKLMDTVLRTAMAQAGADRGLLLLPRAGETRIAAEATTLGDRGNLELRDDPVSGSILPESILNYVLRTQANVILDDALADSSFSVDPYIRQNQPRSVLCLPLIKQAKLIGVIYLENTLAPRVFVPARTAVLKLVASQAAIALENSSLYRDLAEREAKIRRLVDANIIGIFTWDIDGRILEANDAFLQMVGYDREDIAQGRMRWTDMTPPDWRRTQRWQEETRTGLREPFEKEYFRKDGSRVPVLIGEATFEGTANQGVAWVLDLSERKRAEHALDNARAELSHMSRLTTMGELTASIAHEVKQPLTGIVSSGHASLRYLDADPRDIGSARRAVQRMINDAFRASEVIEGIRAMVKKSSERKTRLNTNEIILKTLEFVSTELQRSNVSLQTELSDSLPSVLGDQVQLQQVLLNLVMNAKDAMIAVDQGPRELSIRSEIIQPDQVLVTVRDSGPALEPAKFNEMFQPFHTTKANGMGLGLSISRSIVEDHGGRLWATPNEPHGAVFQFTLPAWHHVQETEISEFAALS